MLKTLVLLIGSSPSFTALVNPSHDAFSWHQDVVCVENIYDNQDLRFVSTCHLFEDQWNTLPQAVFWQQIMTLSPDSVIVNVASNRQMLMKCSYKDWSKQTEQEKSLFKDSIRTAHELSSDEMIYVTSGKNHFYRFHDVIPTISRGVEVFSSNFVDPWYAQAILLIESPGRLQKSTAGAYGPFQLMKGVAINQGLTVNKNMDERADFDRSAWAASQLIKKICIPEARKILDAHGITTGSYKENELWFRLFVMHIYHAGSGNVAKVVSVINPKEGGQQLIQDMWQNKAGGFGNASQNYSQVVLAALLTLDQILIESQGVDLAAN